MKYFLNLILLCLLSLKNFELSAQESTIIKWGIFIQKIPFLPFTDWPGVEGRGPITATLSSNRVWLAWPEALVSINLGGLADGESLLNYYASRSARIRQEGWSPAMGFAGQEGLWRGIDEDGSTLRTLNTLTGQFTKQNLHIPAPDALYPLANKRILVIADDKLWIIGDSADEVPNNETQTVSAMPIADWPSSASRLAVSPESLALAWWDTRKRDIRLVWLGDPAKKETHKNDADKIPRNKHIKDFILAYPRISSTILPGLPEIPPFAITWSGDSLICGYPGYLLIINRENNQENIEVLQDPLIPLTWYQLSGEEGWILLHHPRHQSLTLIKKKTDDAFNVTKTEFSGETLNTEVRPLFDRLLDRYLLLSGEKLETSLTAKAADDFFRWSLPFVRERRSRYPLDEAWSELEKTLGERRENFRVNRKSSF